jgi:hypothetical protein
MPLTIENAIGFLSSSVSGDVQYFELPTGVYPDPVITSPNPASIQVDQKWQVKFKFTASGIFFKFFGAAVKWDCDILMEQFGPDDNPATLPSITIPGVNALSNTFSGTINLNPGDVPEGVYRLVARLCMRPTSSSTILATGFIDLGMVQFYKG